MLTEYVKGNSRVQLVNIDTGFVQVNIIHPVAARVCFAKYFLDSIKYFCDRLTARSPITTCSTT